jgi:hypothetical protein
MVDGAVVHDWSAQQREDESCLNFCSAVLPFHKPAKHGEKRVHEQHMSN